GGILGMLGTVAVDAYVEDVMFLCVTDIQLVEKAPEGVIVRSDSAQNLAQGMAGTQNQTYSEVGKFKKYRTRVVSTANQMNLVYEDAAEPLTRGLARSLAGLF
ncbi:MAG TPA: complement resistance protein TraT, partial [Nitrospirales bacterium]|nr:complement resistance protein TraT [Nitrospirales bacterium]